MALIGLRGVCVGFGGPLLLDGVDLQIGAGERVCLLGRNGVGKSTLMRLVHGDLEPDHGDVVRQQGVRTALLAQEVPQGLQGTTFDIVAGGLVDADIAVHAVQEDIQGLKRRQVGKIISRMNLDPDAPIENLSAGLKRRVMLARGLVRDPELLLLDEPTNHLDIEAIGWMEEFLLRFSGTLLFTTHDRMFLRRLATRIVELDRGRLVDWSCDYDTFEERKQASLDVEAGQCIRWDKKLAREEVWIRQGIKARRTRNEGRVRELEKMREVRLERRERMGSVRMRAQDARRSGKLVIEAEDVTFGYDGGQPILNDFSTIVMRGDRIGIIGPNGSGKTTLLRLLLGELQPQGGSLRHGVHLEVAYFDQLRMQLDEDRSVAENVGEGNDTIVFNGKPRHILSYLQDFLFSQDRALSPVRILSGGERNRLLLARLFIKPSNVLVMDEPTNDLDTDTLELLEELLLDYSGTLLLVSHDRAFLNNVVTGILSLEPNGGVGEYVGGYDDWLLQRAATIPHVKTEKSPPGTEKKRPPKREPRRTLSYKENRELESLPEHIESLEAEQNALYQKMADPDFYRGDGTAIASARARLKDLEHELEQTYRRWEYLEALNGGSIIPSE